MKFSCERCGKKYSTAETPAPGRAYRIDCKACGHLVIVKASPEPPSEAAYGRQPGTEQHGGDSTQEISMTGIDDLPAGEDKAASADALYVDLFADAPRPDVEQTDPFLAARGLVPEAHAESSSPREPHAPLRRPLSPMAAATPSPPRFTGHVATTTPKIPDIPRPPKHGSALPMALIGAGALVVIGIVAFVLLGGRAPVAPPRAAVQADSTVALPEARRQAASPPGPPAPVAAAPDAPKPPKPAVDTRSADERRPRERGARDAKERERLAREQRARAERDERQADDRERRRRDSEVVAAANQQDDPGGLSQAAVERVLTSTRNAFESCILAAARSRDVTLDGRRVLLRLNIQNTGAVTYPTLDDVTLNGTELGSCLKNAARLMVFPKFKGDPLHVEVPLALVGR